MRDARRGPRAHEAHELVDRVDQVEDGEGKLPSRRPLEAEGDHRQVERVEPEVLAEASCTTMSYGSSAGGVGQVIAIGRGLRFSPKPSDVRGQRTDQRPNAL